MGRVHIAAAPTTARLHIHLRGSGIHGFNSDPDVGLVDLALKGADGVGIVVGDELGEKHTVVLNHRQGGLINLFDGSLVAVALGILAPGARERMGIADGFDTAGGDKRGTGENG